MRRRDPRTEFPPVAGEFDVISNWQDARKWIALGLLCAGCTGQPAVERNDPPQETNTTSPIQTVQSAEPKAISTQTAPVATTRTAINPDAQEAFQTLIAPGVEPATWEKAQQKLIELGAEAAPVLLRGIQSKNPVEREMAATVCALSGNPNAELQAALVACLGDNAPFVRASAAAALASVAEHQDQAFAVLTDLLTASDPQLRRMAAANLSSFGEEASDQLPKLTAVLANDDTEVVMPVIHLLGRMGPTAIEAVPELQRIAFEETGEVRQAAEQALLQIQATEKTPE